MRKIMIVYWSGTGNTELMANMIADGVKAASGIPEIAEVSAIAPADLQDYQAFALGCPSMGAEVLEEDSMEPFVEALEGSISGKQIGLFGSYGWGDGEWMRNWVDRMNDAGASVIDNEGIIACGEPDTDVEERLKELGKILVSVS